MKNKFSFLTKRYSLPSIMKLKDKILYNYFVIIINIKNINNTYRRYN